MTILMVGKVVMMMILNLKETVMKKRVMKKMGKGMQRVHLLMKQCKGCDNEQFLFRF